MDQELHPEEDDLYVLPPHVEHPTLLVDDPELDWYCELEHVDQVVHDEPEPLELYWPLPQLGQPVQVVYWPALHLCFEASSPPTPHWELAVLNKVKTKAKNKFIFKQ